jgi:stage II sporulation protein D
VAGNERDVIVRGEALRSVLTMTFGAAAVRSTWFHIRRTGETVVFEGRGFGHGAGLCQAGALARARAGASLEAILGFYYPGARLTPDFPYNKDGPRRR